MSVQGVTALITSITALVVAVGGIIGLVYHSKNHNGGSNANSGQK